MLQYSQGTGRWTRKFVSDGIARHVPVVDPLSGLQVVSFSGHEQGRNQPALQADPNLGPIPQGDYTVGPPFLHPRLGPFTMALWPAPTNQMFTRGAFFIHAPTPDEQDQSSSLGCIVTSASGRVAIAACVKAGTDQLRVIR